LPALCFNNDDTSFLLEAAMVSKAMRGDKDAMNEMKDKNQGISVLSASADSDLNKAQIKLLHAKELSTSASSATQVVPEPVIASGGSSVSTDPTVISTEAGASALTSMVKIRVSAIEKPITQPPRLGPSKASKLDKRGVKVSALSGNFQHLVSIVTFSEKLAFQKEENYGTNVTDKKGFIHYKVTDRIHFIIRTPDLGIHTEAQLAMYKKTEILNQKMVEHRENLICSFITANNAEYNLRLESNLSVAEMRFLDRSQIDLSDWIILSMADGCGPEVAAVRSLAEVDFANIEEFESYLESEYSNELDEEIEDDSPQANAYNTEVNSLTRIHQPEHMIDLKHTNKMTNKFQLQDVGPGFKLLKAEHKSEKYSLKEGIDDQRVPLESNLMYAICKRHFPAPSAQRTFYKFMINFDIKANIAFAEKNYIQGAYVCGHGSTDALTFLRGWSGFNTLQPGRDYPELERIIPLLIEIARAHGSCPRECWEPIMMKFIHERHVEALSDIALQAIAADYLKKPEGQRPLNQQGAVIITSPGRLEQCRLAAIKKREDILLSVHADALKQANLEIKRAEEILRRERTEATKRKKMQRDQEESDAVRQLYYLDAAGSVDEAYQKKWNNSKFCNVHMLQAAYRIFVPNPPADHPKNPKRAQLLYYLEPILAFYFETDELWQPVVLEELDDASDTDSDDDEDD